MPPKLNIKRTNVAPEFIDLLTEMYATWLQKNDGLIQQGLVNKRFEHFAFTARRMLPIVRKQSPSARVGLDYELTRLRGLPFTDFTVVTGPHPDGRIDATIRWLVGRTNHVTATHFQRRREIMGELGRYDIYIPETVVAQPNLYHIHMIPQRNQRSINRHFHHYLQTDEVRHNPLNYPTGNCWGDYSGPLKGLMDEPDYPELFRQLFNHLCTYGHLPPRTTLDFDMWIAEAK